jgi:hypothetical protein
MMRYITAGVGFLIAVAAASVMASAQDMGAMSDADYIAKASAAAPASVAKGATIVRMDGQGMRTLQTGSNGFTCMVVGPGDAMCADQNAMQWANAYLKHGTPPSNIGFVYMLSGDNGASNTDPYATAQSPNNHWVKTGPHVMIVGPMASNMGYPASPDPDPTKPYVMWAGTPYAHVMIPVSSSAPQ